MSTRLEQTRKDNRRLQLLIFVLILVVVTAALYLFRGYFHLSSPSKPEQQPAGAPPDGKPGAQQPVGALPLKPAKAAGITEWSLDVPNRPEMALIQGCELQKDDVVGGASGERFARVAMRKQKMRMINDSSFVWIVVSTDGKTSNIKNGEDFVLGAGEQTITFAEGVSGTIKPIPLESVPPAPGSPCRQLPAETR